jgi:DNA-binding beta-propeller fold protein YncE
MNTQMSSMSRAARCIAAALAVLLTPAAFAQQPPLTQIRTTALPEIVGDFDHFAVDLKRNHLFVSAEKHQSVEVFDVRTGEHLQSIPGFKTPHSLAFAPEKDELLVADGGDSALILLAATDFHRIDHIQLIDGSATGKGDSPDAAYYDAANRLYYIGNGGVSAGLPDSTISIFSVDQGKLLDAKFSVPGNNVESMGIDNEHRRLYVNIRDKQQIGIFDLDTKQLITTWTTGELKANTALVVDVKNQ